MASNFLEKCISVYERSAYCKVDHDKKVESKIRSAFGFANIQQVLLEKLGYKNLAPLSDSSIWFYIKDEKFHTVDIVGNHNICRNLEGDILLCLNDDGYNYCEPSNKNESKSYKANYGEYYLLWENDEFITLDYLYCCHNNVDKFEFIKEENYVAIRYHEKKENRDSIMSEKERLIKKPLKDSIISRENDIYHIKVFTYYYNDKIVVFDGNQVIIYDKEFNIIYEYERYNEFEIWEVDFTSYILFPYERFAYDLCEGKKIDLPHDDNVYWYAKTYKDIAVLYTTEHFPRQEYDSGYDEQGYYIAEEDIPPVRNTTGIILDSSLKCIRDFNVIGEISSLKEIGGTIFMGVNSSLERYKHSDLYYNVRGQNITIHNSKTNEDISVPDIAFRYMHGFEYSPDVPDLYVVTKMETSSKMIDFKEGTSTQYTSLKSGVYYLCDPYEYRKIIDCKYDYIKSLPLRDDPNIYYAGVTGLDDDNEFDLYINHKIVLQGEPFNKGNSVKLTKDKMFIQITNSDNQMGIIRNGKFLLDPIYENVKTFVEHNRKYYDPDIEDGTLNYLFVVSDGESFGICSPSGKLILPMEYSNIDIDNNLNIVLVRDFNAELDDECDESVKEMLEYDGNIYETGYYDEEKDIIVTEKACFKDGQVILNEEDNYIWDESFIDLNDYDDMETDY